jgi:translation initiation factor IF-2
VREVATGYECGIGVEGFDSFEVGDRIEVYRREQVKGG